ncbi:lipase family protein [Flavobacterium restrictum]|uniref:Lipase n=1 Tax=Flavobacterium restrictum TaxID=2594428 RepID=A0A553DWF2_9FLAO|nr:lipase [Flavobacterium restrictum]TRX37099.1 lipase [Flavobacterium restrictum]
MKSNDLNPLTKKHQVISILAALSNCNQNVVKNTENELQDNLSLQVASALQNPIIKAYIGDWDIVWGPCTKNSRQRDKNLNIIPNAFITDNAMFVAKGQDPDDETKTLYVIAVSGTNGVSKFGWLDEDFKVETKLMKSWGTIPDAKIAGGSHDGLTILRDLKNHKNQDVISFLSQLPLDQNTEVTTCGHSLAGALSPLLALTIIEWKEKENKAFLVSTYPSAGSSSGNKAFAAYAESKFGNNYHSVINNYDIVPHAWNSKTFLKIPNIYHTPEFGNLKILTATQAYKTELGFLFIDVTLLKNSHYTRIFDEKPQEYRFDGKPSEKATNTFIEEAGFQHINAYNSPKAFYYGDNDSAVATAVNSYLKH